MTQPPGVLIRHRDEILLIPDVSALPEGYAGGVVGVAQPRGTFKLEEWSAAGTRTRSWKTPYTRHGAVAAVLGRVPTTVLDQQDSFEVRRAEARR